jgi:hypothetical protein
MDMMLICGPLHNRVQECFMREVYRDPGDVTHPGLRAESAPTQFKRLSTTLTSISPVFATSTSTLILSQFDPAGLLIVADSP